MPMNNQDAERVFFAWKAVQQNHLPPESVDGFYRFLGSWMMFNALYTQPDQRPQACSSTRERDHVESFADYLAFGQSHQNLLNLDEIYKAAVKAIADRRPNKPAGLPALPDVKVWNLNPTYQSNPSNHGYCANQNDLRGLLGCLYVARCNLIHGGKTPGDAIDLSLCESAHIILSRLLLQHVLK